MASSTLLLMSWSMVAPDFIERFAFHVLFVIFGSPSMSTPTTVLQLVVDMVAICALAKTSCSPCCWSRPRCSRRCRPRGCEPILMPCHRRLGALQSRHACPPDDTCGAAPAYHAPWLLRDLGVVRRHLEDYLIGHGAQHHVPAACFHCLLNPDPRQE